jgi:hypothetical protein
MKNIKTKYVLCILLIAICTMFTSCLKDLNKFPLNDTTKVDVYKDLLGYKMALAKVYGTMALSGNQGPAGKPDVEGLDEGGNGDFLRCFFNHQEMPTDEAHCLWQDPGVPELNNMNFVATCSFTIGLYTKSILQIMYANDFLRNCTPAELNGKGFSQADLNEIADFAAEARYIRAFQYWVLMDVFGNPPFVTENDELNVLPRQTNRSELFDYVESELIELGDGGKLKAPKANEYGRVDQAAAWALLARLYLNANVYQSPVGSPGDNADYYTKAITYSNKVISSGYSLRQGRYQDLFLNDNHLNNPEVIYSINYDGAKTQGYGGMTFLINCTSNGDYQTTYKSTLLHYGMFANANWAGYRARGEFINLFDASNDSRYLFVGANQFIGNNPTNYAYGYAGYKYRNIPSTLTLADVTAMTSETRFGNDATGTYADNDYPLFRLAEMYLIYAEAVKRGGAGGSEGTAVNYLNELRSRAGLTPIASYDLNYILDERGREMYWECQRRTDLVRYNRFTTADYIWEWKGGVQAGQAVDAHYNIYPIPYSDIAVNPNLHQNQGY